MAKILVIDDEELIRTTLRRMFELAGHEVETAADGSVGLDMFNEAAFDVVITDIIMPEREGLDTITQIRKTDAEVIIVGISGDRMVGNHPVLNLARTLGASATLQKPFRPREMVSLVERLLA